MGMGRVNDAAPDERAMQAAREIYEKFIEWKCFDPDKNPRLPDIIHAAYRPLRERCEQLEKVRLALVHNCDGYAEELKKLGDERNALREERDALTDSLAWAKQQCSDGYKVPALREELDRAQTRIADLERKLVEFTPEDIREMAYGTNALLSQKLDRAYEALDAGCSALKNVQGEYGREFNCELAEIVKYAMIEAEAVLKNRSRA
jgi:chromosome segregation ATPase